MTYTLKLKKRKQRVFHFHDYLNIQFLPHINEHIIIDNIKYTVVDVEHLFSNTVIKGIPTLIETEQYGTIYGLELDN